MKLTEYLIINNNIIPLREDDESSLSDNEGMDKINQLNQLDSDSEDAVSIDEANRVLAPDGTYVDMDLVRSILGDAIDQLTSMIDPKLVNYYNYINIVYTWQVETFATCTEYLFINPSFLMNLFETGDIPFVAYVLLHECYHVILGHCDDPKANELAKKGEREDNLCNRAQDYQINWMIENSTFENDEETGKDVYPFEGMTKLLGGCIDPDYSCLDWPDIYKILDELYPGGDAKIDDEGQVFEPENPDPEKMSDEWYDGFLEGIGNVYDELRNNNLIESTKFKSIYTALNEVVSSEIYGENDSLDDAIKKILSSNLSTAEKAKLILAASRRKDDEAKKGNDSGLGYGGKGSSMSDSGNDNGREQQGQGQQGQGQGQGQQGQGQNRNGNGQGHIGQDEAGTNKSSGGQHKTIDDLRREKAAQKAGGSQPGGQGGSGSGSSGGNQEKTMANDERLRQKAERAKNAAQAAAQAAEQAQAAAQAAAKSEASGDMQGAMNSAKTAAQKAQQAENANMRAGGTPVPQQASQSGTPTQQAQQSAKQAQQSAKAAQDAFEKAMKELEDAQNNKQGSMGPPSTPQDAPKSEKQRAAEKAQRAADAAQKAADAAQKAADKARAAENKGNMQAAQDANNAAQQAAQQAEQANQQAGGDPVSQSQSNSSQSPADQAQEAANRAQEAATNAQKAADKAQEDACQEGGGDNGASSGNNDNNEQKGSKEEEEARQAQMKADTAQEEANKKRAEADAAERAAQAAQDAADDAKASADDAKTAESNNDKSGAKNAAKDAAQSAESAEKSNKEAGGDPVSQKNVNSKDSSSKQADTSAQNAQQSADNAKAAAEAADAEAKAAQEEADRLQQEANEAWEKAGKPQAQALQEKADAAKKAAQEAQEAADRAAEAAEAAQEAEDNGDTEAAEAAAEEASQASDEAETANQQAGGQPTNKDNNISQSPAQQAKADAERAQEAANNAQQAAEAAQQAADDAKANKSGNSKSENSKSAQSQAKAQAAKEKAEQAQAEAQAAQDAADAAKEAAKEATEAAEAAQEAEDAGDMEAAEDAADAAENAADAAESANQQAGGKPVSQNSSKSSSPSQRAQDAAERAQESADNAQEAANEAREDAEQAQADAEVAQAEADNAAQSSDSSKAAQAQAKADAARRKAVQAESKADNAENAAQTAKEAAQDATAAADAAREAENLGDTKAAEAAAESAENAANKAEFANQQAGGESVEDNSDSSMSSAEKAEDAAERAQQSADNAQAAADAAREAAEAAQAEAEAAQAEAEAVQAEEQSSDNPVSEHEKRKAEQRAEKAEEKAKKAKDAAKKAQAAANRAKIAAEDAKERENAGDDAGAEESYQDAMSEAENANDAASQAGAEKVNTIPDVNKTAAERAEDAAEQAQMAADRADDEAHRLEQEAEQLRQEADNMEVEKGEEETPESMEYSEFEDGKAFGQFVGGLIYKNDGNAKEVIDTLRKKLVLPDVPDMKLKHSIRESYRRKVFRKLFEATDDEILQRIMHAIDSGGKTDTLLSNIMDAIVYLDEPSGPDTNKPAADEPKPQEPLPKKPGGTPEIPLMQGSLPKIDNGKPKIKVTTADGKYTGRAKFNDGRHTISSSEAQEIMKRREALTPRSKNMDPAKKSHSKVVDDRELFNAIGGHFNLIDSVCKRSIGRGIEVGGLSLDEIRKRVKDYPEQIKGRILAASHNIVPWNNILRDYLKGAVIKHNDGYTGASLARVARGLKTGEDATLKHRVEKGQQVGKKLVVFLDTSGSVLGSEGKINQVIGEIIAIAKERVNTGRGQSSPMFAVMDIILFNSDIDNENSLHNVPTSDLAKIKGLKISSGGTNYGPVYDYMYDNYTKDKDVSAILIISDSDATCTSNRFSIWTQAFPAEAKEVAKLGSKTIFFAFYDGCATAQDYKYSTLPNAKVKVLEKESVLHESLKNMKRQGYHVIKEERVDTTAFDTAPSQKRRSIKNIEESASIEAPESKLDGYYHLDEAGFKTRRGGPIKTPATPTTPAPADSISDTSVNSTLPDDSNDEPNGMVITDDDLTNMSSIIAKVKKDARAMAAASGSHIFNKDIHEWIKVVYGWRLKQINTTQEVMELPQTYCVTGNNKVYINNETFDTDKHNQEVAKLKQKNHDSAAEDSKYDYLVPANEKQPNGEILSKLPKNAFREGYVDADVDVLSYRGNLIIEGFTGTTLPKFMPKRIVKGSYTGNEDKCGNLTIRNCRNLESFDNFPVYVEGIIKISGCPKLKDPTKLNKYREDVENAIKNSGSSASVKNKIRFI